MRLRFHLYLLLFAIMVWLLMEFEELAPMILASSSGGGALWKKRQNEGKILIKRTGVPGPLNNERCEGTFAANIIKKGLCIDAGTRQACMPGVEEKLNAFSTAAVKLVHDMDEKAGLLGDKYQTKLNSITPLAHLDSHQQIVVSKALHMIQFCEWALLLQASTEPQICHSMAVMASGVLIAGNHGHRIPNTSKVAYVEFQHHTVTIAGPRQVPEIRPGETMLSYLTRLGREFTIFDFWICPHVFVGSPDAYLEHITGTIELQQLVSRISQVYSDLPDLSSLPRPLSISLQQTWSELADRFRVTFPDIMDGLFAS